MAKFEKGNEWVKKAIAGKYEYNTGGADKKGKRPGFGKKGAVTTGHSDSMKDKVPTHGTDGAC
jgi:hypothetical protein